MVPDTFPTPNSTHTQGTRGPLTTSCSCLLVDRLNSNSLKLSYYLYPSETQPATTSSNTNKHFNAEIYLAWNPSEYLEGLFCNYMEDDVERYVIIRKET